MPYSYLLLLTRSFLSTILSCYGMPQRNKSINDAFPVSNGHKGHKRLNL